MTFVFFFVFFLQSTSTSGRHTKAVMSTDIDFVDIGQSNDCFN